VICACAVDTRGAVEGVELIVISIPFPAVAELPKDLFDAVPQAAPETANGGVSAQLRVHKANKTNENRSVRTGQGELANRRFKNPTVRREVCAEQSVASRTGWL
jgi:hypothetical protein